MTNIITWTYYKTYTFTRGFKLSYNGCGDASGHTDSEWLARYCKLAFKAFCNEYQLYISVICEATN